MDPKIIFSILLVVTFLYFTMGAGSRLLKKKSHHYIVPPACEDDPNWQPVEFEDYKKQIYIKPNSEEEDLRDIKLFLDENSPNKVFDIASRNNWFIVHANDLNFEDFHLLVATWHNRMGYKVFGFCSNENKPRKDYIVKVDASVDHLIGTFRDNRNFGIYLPKSGVNAKGNISNSPVAEIYFDAEIANLPLENN